MKGAAEKVRVQLGFANSYIYIYQCTDLGRITMRTIIQVHREDDWFVAVDLITNVADQGSTEEEAVSNLKKGLEEHYQILMELSPKGYKTSFLDI